MSWALAKLPQEFDLVTKHWEEDPHECPFPPNKGLPDSPLSLGSNLSYKEVAATSTGYSSSSTTQDAHLP